MKIKIGRSIEGIALNGYAWLLDGPDGNIKWFDSRKEAEQLLFDSGICAGDLYLYCFVSEDNKEVAADGTLLGGGNIFDDYNYSGLSDLARELLV
jgi:hypothetical protein